jgi:poly(beta-D-mannuronate) lyase
MGIEVRKIVSRMFLAVLLSAAINCTDSYAASPAGETCPVFPPVMSLSLADIYADAKGSVPNEAAVRGNRDLIAGLDQFMRYLEQALDSPNARQGDAAVACAYGNFKQWATARALTVEPKPYSREGATKRGEYLIGIDILALKFKAAGFAMDGDMLAWLRTLNHENITSYERASNRGNLRIWSAAAAALYAIIERDPATLDFQDRVWHEAMAAIHDDGTIDAEMARGQRALIYHMFSLSATLVLRSAREALGYPETPQDHSRLKRLADMIGHTLCKPGDIEHTAQAIQEIPGDWGYRIPVGFGADMLDQDWSRCGRPHAALSDPTSGGDARHSADLLSRFAKQAERHPAAH